MTVIKYCNLTNVRCSFIFGGQWFLSKLERHLNEKNTRQHPWTLKFKLNRTPRDCSLPKFWRTENLQNYCKTSCACTHCAPQAVHSKSCPAHWLADRQLSEKQVVIRILAPPNPGFFSSDTRKINNGPKSLFFSTKLKRKLWRIFGESAKKKKKMNWHLERLALKKKRKEKKTEVQILPQFTFLVTWQRKKKKKRWVGKKKKSRIGMKMLAWKQPGKRCPGIKRNIY